MIQFIFRPSFSLRNQQSSQQENNKRNEESAKKAGNGNQDHNAVCDDEEECHLHYKKAKKISNYCKKRNLARKLSARLCGGGGSGRTKNGLNLGPNAKKLGSLEEDVEDPMLNACSSSLEPTLSTSQRQSTTHTVTSCVLSSTSPPAPSSGQNFNNFKTPNIEIVAVDVITNQRDGPVAGTFC